MINGEHYYFFRLDRFLDDPLPEYRIARSIHDLYLRFGHKYVSSFSNVTKLNEVTVEHIRAIDEFLLQQLS